MNVKALSTRFTVRKLSKDDISTVLILCKGNPLYYQFCPPAVSVDSIKSDMIALPPNKTIDDKYFIGFYLEDELIAVMDLISKWPNDETAFIGFFMMNTNSQGSGIGTRIISECVQYLKSIQFRYIKLGYVKENYQAKSFWQKNGFKPTGKETQQENYTVVAMEREL
ncbi:GNAT family N-acetyltransferase [Amedibacillus sp. YH-ame6]